jgi:uncharacterized protein (DUF1778 family)
MPKSEFIKLRLDPEEKQAFQEAADLAGVSLSAWIRERLRKSARIELEDAGQQIAFLMHRPARKRKLTNDTAQLLNQRNGRKGQGQSR